MKKTITLCVALCATVAVYAQRQLATLNHNDSISVYYGENALSTALGASVNGDIITLSPGIFNGAIITKAVTIRGAGAESSNPTVIRTITGSLIQVPMYDTIYGINNSYRPVGSFIIYIPDDSVNYLRLEGLRIENKIQIVLLDNPLFLKCHFSSNFGYLVTGISSGPGGTNWHGFMRNAKFINCRIMYWPSDLGTYLHYTGTIFQNSIIMSSMSTSMSQTLINCVASTYSNSYWNGLSAINSIILFGIGSNYPNYAYNCIGINPAGASWVDEYSGQCTEHNVHNFSNTTSIFSNQYTYTLLDSIATNYLGDDSTQIGIYGGQYPFNLDVTNPHIIRCNVARRATADGRLPVDIEIVNE